MLHKPTPAYLPPSAPKIPRKCHRSALHSPRLSIKMGKINPAKEHKRKEIEESAHEHGKQKISTDGDVQEQDEGWETTTTSRAKRSRRTYSLGNADVSKKPAHSHSQESPPLLSRVDEDSLKPTSKSTGCDSSASNSEDRFRDGNQESVPSGGKKLKLIEELESPDSDDKETRDHSSFSSDCMDATMETVQVTVNASPGGENIPFVSLTSEAYGIAVIGYPIDVGEIRDGSDTSSLPKESADCNLFSDRTSRFDKLVWRTSRRTPVCYVNVRREAPLTKNTKQFNRDKTAKNKGCVPVKVIFSKMLAAVD